MLQYGPLGIEVWTGLVFPILWSPATKRQQQKKSDEGMGGGQVSTKTVLTFLIIEYDRFKKELNLDHFKANVEIYLRVSLCSLEPEQKLQRKV